MKKTALSILLTAGFCIAAFAQGTDQGRDLSKYADDSFGEDDKPLLLLAKELLDLGKEVTVVLGFNKADEICLAEEFRSLGIPVHIATMDGSVGTKGFVTDAINEVEPEFDRYYACGPLPMMKAVCSSLPAPGEVSMEERMGCGAGFCYGCSLQTANGPKRICADGPVFNKEELIW